MGDNNLPVPIRVIRINEKIAELKDDFAAFIVDKSRPLEQRWEVFKKANDALSNHEPYGATLDIPHIDLTELYDGLPKVPDEDITEFVELIQEYGFHTESQINEIKEWILEKNLKSFSYDW